MINLYEINTYLLSSLIFFILYISNKLYKFFDMKYFIKESYIYNLSWEDPKTDIKLYNIKKNSKICMITTGGDNVLDYLIEDPKYICTYDLNKHQNYLLELKMACIKELNHNECLEIFGRNNYELFNNKFEDIKKHLSFDARKWWEENKEIMRSFIYSGSVKHAARLSKFLLWVFGCKGFMDNIKKNPGIENQRKEFKKYETRFRYFCNFLESIKYYVISWIGVPIRQLKLDDDKDYIYKVIFNLCNNTDLVRDNYFFTGYLYGELNEESCPRYLKKENFDIVKSRLDRVTIYTGLLQDEITKVGEDRKFDRVILLDHMDWLNEKQIRDEWLSVSKHVTKDCLFCWRSYSKNQSFGCLEGLDYQESGFIDKVNVNKYFDRIGMYNSVHVAKLNDTLYNVDIPKYNLSFIDFLYTFKNICLSPFTIKKGENFLDNFYESQADYYDAYRHYFLHGKKELMTSLPVKKGSSLLLFAGGTGDVLNYIKNVIDKFDKITIMDICEPLLKKAKEKVKKNNWENVEVVKGDAHTFVRESEYDIVLITYSITMIPKWKLAIDNAYKCLKSNGYMGVCDFTTKYNKLPYSDRFWKKIFSMDNVYINDEHIDYLNKKMEKIFFREDFGGFPFIPFLKVGYYSTLLKKIKKD